MPGVDRRNAFGRRHQNQASSHRFSRLRISTAPIHQPWRYPLRHRRAPEQRYLTIHGQIYSPDDKSKILLPLCFCRECGQEYYSVYLAKDPQTGVQRMVAREAHERTVVPGQQQGLLYINPAKPWPKDTETEAQMNWLPTDWVEERNGRRQIVASRRERMPRHYIVQPDGTLGADGLAAAFIPVPFMFCLSCGVSHTARQRSDFSKLGTLGSEGRST